MIQLDKRALTLATAGIVIKRIADGGALGWQQAEELACVAIGTYVEETEPKEMRFSNHGMLEFWRNEAQAQAKRIENLEARVHTLLQRQDPRLSPIVGFTGPTPVYQASKLAVEPDPNAPTSLAKLPDFWDRRRELDGKPDKSRCAAELRVALERKVDPEAKHGD